MRARPQRSSRWREAAQAGGAGRRRELMERGPGARPGRRRMRAWAGASGRAARRCRRRARRPRSPPRSAAPAAHISPPAAQCVRLRARTRPGHHGGAPSCAGASGAAGYGKGAGPTGPSGQAPLCVCDGHRGLRRAQWGLVLLPVRRQRTPATRRRRGGRRRRRTGAARGPHHAACAWRRAPGASRSPCPLHLTGCRGTCSGLTLRLARGHQVSSCPGLQKIIVCELLRLCTSTAAEVTQSAP